MIRYLVAALLVASQANASGIREDHTMHIGVAAVATTLSAGVFQEMGATPVASRVIAAGAVMFLGHLKESSDPFYDSSDMAANAAGVGAGLLLSWSFSL